MSEAKRFWCHEAQNIRCVRESDYDAALACEAAERLRADVAVADCNEAERREAALREELETRTADLLECGTKRKALQQRLTDAENRAAVMEKALTRIARENDCGCWPCTGSCVSQAALEITVEAMRDIAAAALKQVEGEGS